MRKFNILEFTITLFEKRQFSILGWTSKEQNLRLQQDVYLVTGRQTNSVTSSQKGERREKNEVNVCNVLTLS